MLLKCRTCESMVLPQKHVNPIWVIFWLVILWPVALIYFGMADHTKCPRCGKHVYH